MRRSISSGKRSRARLSMAEQHELIRLLIGCLSLSPGNQDTAVASLSSSQAAQVRASFFERIIHAAING